MAYKHVNRCSTSLVIEKWKSKLQWAITSHQSEWPSSKKSTNNNFWRGCGEKGTLLQCWWECKLIQSLYRTGDSQVALVVKNLPANAGDVRDMGSIPGLGRSLENEMATHSRILAWRIPWTKKPGGLQSTGSPRVNATEGLSTCANMAYPIIIKLNYD